MKIVFAGTSAFAVPALDALVAAGHSLNAVYTQPDRARGRGQRPAASPVKQRAQALGLAVFQPVRLNEAAAALRAVHPEALVVVAYGQILPPEILSIPPHGCLNVHASLLPRWRGAAPVARAIEAGDRISGVSVMRMTEGLDAGPVLACATTPIDAGDTAQTLHDRLARLGADTLIATLARVAANNARAEPQDESQACYARKLHKEEGWLDWSRAAADLQRQVRAFNPYPVACTRHGDRVLRLWEAGPLESGATAEPPGTVLSAHADGIRVATGTGVLTILRLQAPGARVLAANEFLNGYRLVPGERLRGSAAHAT